MSGVSKAFTRALAAGVAALALMAPPAPAEPLRAGAWAVDATWHVGSAAGQYASACEESLAGGNAGNCPVIGERGIDPAAHSAHRAPSYGVQSRLSARAIVVEGPAGNRWALVKNDLYIPQDLLWRRTAQILQAEGSEIGPSNLSMAVSHNHSSPYHSSISWGVWAFQDVFDARFFEYYAQRMAQAVREAEKRLVPVRVGVAVGQFDKTHKHAFGPANADDGTPAGYPESDTDTDLTVIRFDDVSKPGGPKPLALVMNWSGHPEFLNGNNLISADYQAPVERIVDRATGALTIFTQGAVGTAEPERSRFHDYRERLEFNHREYGQADYAGSLLGAAVVDLWRRIAENDPPDRSRFIPFRRDFRPDEVKGEDRWFGGPISHPYPGVSNCRTDTTAGGHVGIPILGLPDCERRYTDARPLFGPLLGTTGLSVSMFKEAGVPVPDNYSAPSYTGLQEDVDVHLQALRIGDLLLTFCSCEQWKDQSVNIKTRTDKVAGNEYLGYDWSKDPRCQPGSTSCPVRDPADEMTAEEFARMKAQVNNPANGWNDPECNRMGCGMQAESEPPDPEDIFGNFTHDDDEASAEKGYQVTVPVGMVNDYNGYIASYREYQRGDHYRKALTGFGPHSMDYMATRLVKMARRLKDGVTDPEDAGDKILFGKTAASQAHNEGRAQAMGALGRAAIEAWSNLMPPSKAPGAKTQPKSIERFDAAFFTWTGGDNYTDQPVVRVQRSVEGQWRDFADQSGEVQTTFAFPDKAGLPDLLAQWFQGTKEWTWTAHFEAFASNFDTGGVRATPAGTYRFVVDGLSRVGVETKPYHLESAPFEVKPWTGITVEDLRRDSDGTMSFRTGPRNTVTAYDIGNGGLEDIREKTQDPEEERKLSKRAIELGPIDYPDSYAHPQKAEFIYNVHAFRGPPGAEETYCFTCSFRPWADTGEAVAAWFTVVAPSGISERLEAVRRADGRFATPRPLAAGETAFVAAGDVCDGWGNYNGAAALPAGVSLPGGVSRDGRFCGSLARKPPNGATDAPGHFIGDGARSGAPAAEAPAAARDAAPNRIAEVGGDLLGARAGEQCLPRRLAVGSRGIGPARIGWRIDRIRRAFGRSGERAGRTLAYCVRGGGLLVVVFSPKGDARLIVSTARGHEARRGAGPGDSQRVLRRAYPGARRAGARLLVTFRSTRVVFSLGARGARYVAVADRRLLKGPYTLRGYLGRAGFLR